MKNWSAEAHAANTARVSDQIRVDGALRTNEIDIDVDPILASILSGEYLDNNTHTPASSPPRYA